MFSQRAAERRVRNCSALFSVGLPRLTYAVVSLVSIIRSLELQYVLIRNWENMLSNIPIFSCLPWNPVNTFTNWPKSKGRFPLQPYRTETYRISLFPSTRVELLVWTQKKILRYVTIRLKWKPAYNMAVLTGWPYQRVSSD